MCILEPEYPSLKLSLELVLSLIRLVDLYQGSAEAENNTFPLNNIYFSRPQIGKLSSRSFPFNYFFTENLL